MLKQFEQHIDQNLPFLKESKLLVAISGGVDSVVLAYLCKEINHNIALAHCNFNLRGDESDADEAFILQLAEDWELEVFVESFEAQIFAKTQKLSTQMAARELRYSWFGQLAMQLDFDYILTAHHADDNLETFLINLSRGTGLDGLLGIPDVNENIVRPLLPFKREDIKKFAKQQKLQWREDGSNASTKYLRNKLRHDVIPVLKETNPKLIQNFNNTISYLKESHQIIESAVLRVKKNVVSVDGDLVKLNVDQLLKLQNPKAYLFELLKDFNFTEWNDVCGLLKAQSGKQVFSNTHRLLKDRDYLMLSEIKEKPGGLIEIAESQSLVLTSFGQLSIERVKNIDTTAKHSIYVDKSLLMFPLTLRQWQEGDYFYPLGMTGRKKLSKYFKDEKFSLLDKESTWLLCSKNDVVWIVGHRADSRFKVTDVTKAILKITLA